MKKLLIFLPFAFAFISCQELPPEAYFIDKYKITGTIDIDPKIKDKCSGALFIIVRKGASIQPLAVKKKTKYDFPVQFSISPADVLMPQRANEFIDELILMARISKSGSPMPQKGDCESPVITVNAGDRNIKLLINKVKE
ncbi:MAG TPA: hypothetical protein EYH43_00345 [Persephonella sp.]|nr:hypothetical protein [Hydrogenothermaceae bacterium]HIQ24417.1 hypothetical protein [Persephonella sp.]